MATGAGDVRAVLFQPLTDRKLARYFIVIEGGHVGGRWRRLGADKVLQNPVAANHGGGARGVRSDRQDAAVAEQAAAMALVVERDAAELAAEDVRNSIVLREPLVEKRVVGLQKIEHAAVFTQDALKKQL